MGRYEGEGYSLPGNIDMDEIDEEDEPMEHQDVVVQEQAPLPPLVADEDDSPDLPPPLIQPGPAQEQEQEEEMQEAIFPLPEEAYNQGNGNPVQQHPYQLPDYIVECEVQQEGQAQPAYHHIVLHSPEIFLQSSGENVGAYFPQNPLPDHQNVLNLDQVGPINQQNIVRNQGFVYLIPPEHTFSGDAPPNGPVVLFHQQVIIGPPNVRFGPIQRLDQGQFPGPSFGHPMPPPNGNNPICTCHLQAGYQGNGGYNGQEGYDEEGDYDDEEYYDEQEGYQGEANNWQLGQQNGVHQEQVVPMNHQNMGNHFEVEVNSAQAPPQEQDSEISTTTAKLFAEENIDLKNVEDTMDESTMPLTADSSTQQTSETGEQGTSNADATSQETSATSEQGASNDLTSDPRPGPSNATFDNDNGHGNRNPAAENQQPEEAGSIPHVLRNGGMWVLPPGKKSPVRISGGQDALVEWVIRHAGQNYGLVRGMKPRPQKPKLEEHEDDYPDFWPTHFEVESFAEIERQLGVMVPEHSESTDGNSEAQNIDVVESSSEDNAIENSLMETEAATLKDNEKVNTEEQ